MTERIYLETIHDCLLVLNSLEMKQQSLELMNARRALVRLQNTVGLGNEDDSLFLKVLQNTLIDLRIVSGGDNDIEIRTMASKIIRVCDAYSDVLDGENSSFAFENEYIRNEVETILSEALIEANKVLSEVKEKRKELETQKEMMATASGTFELTLDLINKRIAETAKERDNIRLLLHLVELEGRRNNMDEVMSVSDATTILQNVQNPVVISKYLERVIQWMQLLQQNSEQDRSSLSEVIHD